MEKVQVDVALGRISIDRYKISCPSCHRQNEIIAPKALDAAVGQMRWCGGCGRAFVVPKPITEGSSNE